MRIIIFIYFCFVSGFTFLYANTNGGYEDMCDDGVLLTRQFIEKLEANTPFTAADEVHFFGPVSSLNLPRLLYTDFGYISQDARILKQMPTYSIYGELLRCNRTLLLPKSPATVLQFYASKNYSGGTPHFITIFIVSHTKIDGFTYQNEKIVSIRYNGLAKALFYPITVNGKSIMPDLGFYQDMQSKVPRLTASARTIIQAHLDTLP